jgi:hypothetical protein
MRMNASDDTEPIDQPDSYNAGVTACGTLGG